MKNTFKHILQICALSCALFSYPNNLSALTHNQRHVENALGTGILLPAVAALVADISTLTPAEQAHALDALSGEQYTNLIQPNQTGAELFVRRMFNALRYDTLGLHCGQNCWDIQTWAAVGGGESHLKNSHGAKGYRMDDYNVAFGVDVPFNFNFLDCWLTVGLAGSYQHDDIRFKQRGHGEGDHWQGALYYMWNNECFYSFSGTILGSDCVDIKRHINFPGVHRKAKSKARFTEWYSFTETGLNLHCECFYVQPFARIEYSYYRRHALSEKHAGVLDLHIRGKDVSATVSYVGVHLTTNLPWGDLLVSADAAWKYRFNLLKERVEASFREFGDEFDIRGVRRKPNGFVGALNVAKTFCDCWNAYVEVSGEVWDRFSSWDVAGGVSATW